MKYSVLLSVLSLSTIVSSELAKIPLQYRDNTGPQPYRQGVFNDDGIYYGNVNFGGQTLAVTFDTSTPVNWVPSSECHTQTCNNAPKKYDASKSSTSVNTNKPFKVVFDDGCIDGTLYEDNINISGYKLDNLTFVNADTVTGDLGTNRYLGNIGFGGYTDGNWYDAPNHELNLFLNVTLELGLGKGKETSSKLQARDRVPNPVIGRSPAPGRRRKLRKRWYDAYFVIGGIDYSYVDGEFIQLDLPTCDYGESKYWKTSLKTIQLGDTYEETTPEKTLAQFNTGSKYIMAPEESSKCLHEAIHAKVTYQNGQKVYQLPCDQTQQLPSLDFQLGDHYKASIPNTAWFEPDQQDPTMCNSLIRSVCNGKSSTWSLGNAFLNEFYVSFDYPKGTIGLAKPKGSDGAEVGSWQ